MSDINVTARKWSRGWELELDEENITQASKLTHAPQQVRDYLDTIGAEVSHTGWKAVAVLNDPHAAEQTSRI